jgi:hypothetical protein
MRFVVAPKNTMLDAVAPSFDGALLRLYTGPKPNDPSTPPSGTLLAEVELPNPAFPAASGGVLSGNAIGSVNASATGTVGYVVAYESDDTTIIGDITVSTVGGSGELQLTTLALTSGVPVPLVDFTLTFTNTD